MTIAEAFTIYWPVIFAIIGGIISVVTIYIKLINRVDTAKNENASKIELLKSKFTEQGNEISELKGRVNLMQPTLGTIQTDIAVIKNTLEYIKGSVQSKPPVITNNN